MFAYFRAPIPWPELLRRTVRDTLADNCFALAAQLAFYFFLALFPALLLLVALLAQVPLDQSLAAVLDRASTVAPAEVLDMVRRQIQRVREGPPAGLLTLAIAGAVWSSSSAMTAIIYTLNQAYDLQESRPWWHTRLLAIALTLMLAVLTLVGLFLVVGGTDLAAWLADLVGAGPLLADWWTVLQWIAALVLVVLAVNLVYHFAPNAETRWTWVTPGSALATVLWLAGSFGFKLYVANFANFGAVYGSIGGVTVLLLWCYLSGLAILVGAELNAEIDKAKPDRDRQPAGPGRKPRIGAAAEGTGS